jgi:amino acid transporter
VPRSILIAVVAVAAAYMLMNLSILAVMAPAEIVAAGGSIGGAFMSLVHGRWAGFLVTVMIVWTAAAGSFAAILSYARVPYAAARSGHFFGWLAKLHPRGEFPHRSLLLVGGLAIAACLADLETVMAALLTSRILIQFVGQIATIFYIRTRPGLNARLRFRMWFYPIPAVVALVGWLAVFGASDPWIIAYGLGSMVLGGLVFIIWDSKNGGARAALEA